MSKQPEVRSSESHTRVVRAKAETWWTVNLGQLRKVVDLAGDLPDESGVTAVMGDTSATYVGERLVRELIVRGTPAAEGMGR